MGEAYIRTVHLGISTRPLLYFFLGSARKRAAAAAAAGAASTTTAAVDEISGSVGGNS